jgi:hypothetical protein
MPSKTKDVDGRDKPGHDEESVSIPNERLLFARSGSGVEWTATHVTQ